VLDFRVPVESPATRKLPQNECNVRVDYKNLKSNRYSRPKMEARKDPPLVKDGTLIAPDTSREQRSKCETF
jgi:hypothetical protein